jgi:hypothetical protein
MSNRLTTGFKRALRGDLDPFDWKGINPKAHEIRNREVERERRASQMEFEKNNKLLAKAGGSLDAPTQQIKSLRRKTGFKALSPAAPSGGLARTIGILTEVVNKSGTNKSRSAKLKKLNKEHEDAAQLAQNNRYRGILGGLRS